MRRQRLPRTVGWFVAWDSRDSFDGVMRQDVIVPLNATATLYPTTGRFFPWVALLGLIGMLAWAWMNRRRRAPLPEGPVEVAPEERKLVDTVRRMA